MSSRRPCGDPVTELLLCGKIGSPPRLAAELPAPLPNLTSPCKVSTHMPPWSDAADPGFQVFEQPSPNRIMSKDLRFLRSVQFDGQHLTFLSNQQHTPGSCTSQQTTTHGCSATANQLPILHISRPIFTPTEADYLTISSGYQLLTYPSTVLSTSQCRIITPLAITSPIEVFPLATPVIVSSLASATRNLDL